MKRPELLAPAGNFDSLVAAIQAGCDAVYLSGKLYGARSFANNFSNEELIEAIKYAHSYGVKIYVTINTLIYEPEIKNFIEYVGFLYKNDVDAVIIQDIGMFDLIRKIYPDLEIHISTQMHIHNLDGVKLVEKLGASRVVLARETPIELIDKIRKKSNIELEIFIHGALCISYSGQCLMSSLIGGRSGNRGTCAQCCRQPYDLYCDNKKINDEKYLLSTRDLNTLNNIGKLIECGVDSLKIEGRLKRPEYVYIIVSMYRKAIDNYIKYKETKITEKDIKEIKKIFNRNFTDGFIFHSKNSDIINSYRPNHQGITIGKVIYKNKKYIKIKLFDDLNVQDGIRFIGKNDIGLTIQTMYIGNNKVKCAKKGEIVTLFLSDIPDINDIVVKTTDYNQIKNINELINMNNRKVNIGLKIEAIIGNKLKLFASDGINNIKCESDYIVTNSIKCPTTQESIYNQLSKTNDTVFKVTNIDYIIDDNIFIPVKTLNELRRNTLDVLMNKRLEKKNKRFGKYTIDIPDFDKEKRKVIYLNNEKYINNLVEKNYDEIILDKHFINSDKERIRLSRVQENLKELSGKYMVGELGSVYKYSDICDIISDFSLNITNSYSVALLHSLGVKRITLSIEMNEHQIRRLIESYHERYNKHPNLEVIVSDIPETMILKYDIFDGNYIENKKYYLIDKFGNKFPIKRKNNLTIIYNYESLKLNDYEKYYDMGINCLRENSIDL